jgi:cellulose synthase/poly-beta-1,6-N-acetylglucosamine synthase-like glycosyltransferase
MTWILSGLLQHSDRFLMGYYGLSSLVSLVLLGAAARSSWFQRKQEEGQATQQNQATPTPPVSIIVPAHNEEAVIISSLRSLQQLDHPKFEIVVVNDGSDDATLSLLKSEFDLALEALDATTNVDCGEIKGVYRSQTDRRIVVVDKEARGSKADALNCGLNIAAHPYICVVDADSVLERDALMKIMEPIRRDPDLVVASSGVILVGNGLKLRGSQIVSHDLPDGWLENIQLVEYRRTFLVERLAWSSRNMLMIISGAFGVFRKDLVLGIGGYRPNTVGEDLDLVVRMHRRLLESKLKYKIALVPHPGCWTEAPSNLACLGKQRSRWHRGLLEVLVHNCDMLFNRRYGKIGMLAMPYLWAYELFSPIIEFATWISIAFSATLGFLQWKSVFAILGIGVLFSGVVSMCAVLLGFRLTGTGYSFPQITRLAACCFLEQVYYRQLHVCWRLRGFWQYFRGNVSWKSPKRRGFHSPATVQHSLKRYSSEAAAKLDALVEPALR